jgi:pimeloyl-ACP methyl ester carboxylesterase
VKPTTRAALNAAALAAAGAAYQAVCEARDRHRYPPPGRLADIGGRCLHLVDAGQGTPAVVIIPALGENVLGWLPIVRALEDETCVCVYDRAGIGWSDPPPRRRCTPDHMAKDLRLLLDAAGIAPPYIVAGHSLGGIVARRFATRWPDAVAGLVLIDSSHEEQPGRLPFSQASQSRLLWRALRQQARILGARRIAVNLGLIRGPDAEAAREAPPEFAAVTRAFILSTRRRRVNIRELLALARLREHPPGLGSLPLTVLTRTRNPWPEWTVMQDELAALSIDSTHLYALNAGHYIHLDEPGAVLLAIRDLTTRYRNQNVSP